MITCLFPLQLEETLLALSSALDLHVKVCKDPDAASCSSAIRKATFRQHGRAALFSTACRRA